MNGAHNISCSKCDAMPCGYIEQTSNFKMTLTKKYYCRVHMDEIA